jgi:putative restriction endonuclease
LKAYIAITDRDWFELLSQLGSIDETNFWQPSPRGAFKALEASEPLLFKLHSPNNFIVGGGFFSHWSRLPASLAWDTFGEKNGARSLAEMRSRIDRYRSIKTAPNDDPEIGCIILLQPFFFQRPDWIPVPEWRPQIERGKKVDLAAESWRPVWQQISQLLSSRDSMEDADRVAEGAPRYGESHIVTSRLGQGAFRVLVTDAYGRRCAVTGEKVLPILYAAHIRPYANGGEHRVDNGLLLRSDLHILFDKGYVTVTPTYNVAVSRRLRLDFSDGEEYLRFHGRVIALPSRVTDRPAPQFLSWHNEERYLG